MTGEIVAVTTDGLQLKTKTDTVTVKYSTKTKFELDKKMVDKGEVKKGDRAGIVGSKLPTGEVMANEVILGLPARKSGAEAKAGADKAPNESQVDVLRGQLGIIELAQNSLDVADVLFFVARVDMVQQVLLNIHCIYFPSRGNSLRQWPRENSRPGADICYYCS